MGWTLWAIPRRIPSAEATTISALWQISGFLALSCPELGVLCMVWFPRHAVR
jgi:hypothetical protein